MGYLRHRSKIVLGLSFCSILFAGGPLSRAQQNPAPAAGATAEQGRKREVKQVDNSFIINFKDVELEQIIRTFSDITGKNFILEQIPRGKITIVSPVRIPKNQALSVFQAILNLNGYNMVPTSIPNLYRIVPISEAPKANIPIFLPEQKGPGPAETYIIRFYPLKYMDVQEATTLIQPLLSKESASVIAYQATNTLIFVDTALNIDRIVRVLKALDIPSLEPEMEIVYMRFSSAQEIASTLAQIFSETAGAKAGAAAKTARAPGPGKPIEASAGGAAGATIKIIPEQRLNALILIAQRDMLDQAKKIIALLDVQAGDKGVIHVYYCKNAVARELAATLAALAGGGISARSTTQQTRTAETAAGLGVVTPSRSRVEGVGSATLSGGLFEGEIKISADDPTNSLIIIAAPRDYEVLKTVIEQLDIPRRQVFLEAVLLELTIEQGRSLGTGVHAGTPLDNGGTLIAGSAPGGLNSLTLLSLLNQGVTLPNGLTLAALGQPITLPGSSVVVPSAGIILQALASDSNANVLSTPTILTMDNEDAEIQVGQNIPVPTGQTVATGGLSSVSIQRETVGIKLKITPQINESGTIRLVISIEISSVVPSSVGVNVNTLGVTTSLKSASTTVIVKDTQTVVIGGLMQDQRSNTNSRTPILGDIPVLGWLFKSAQKTKNKTNLIILLTPHIVRSDEEVARMRGKFKQEYDSFIEESFGVGEQKWSKYFESQYKGTFIEKKHRTEIDFTGGKPRVVEEENPPLPEFRPEQGPAVKPQQGGTNFNLEKGTTGNLQKQPEAAPLPQSSLPSMKPLAGNGGPESTSAPVAEPEKKKKRWSLKKKAEPEAGQELKDNK